MWVSLIAKLLELLAVWLGVGTLNSSLQRQLLISEQAAASSVDKVSKRMHPPRPAILRLPAEIRNHVYALSLVLSERITVDKDNFTQPNLLRVCRQIREEASGIYYRQNKFSIIYQDLEPTVAINWYQHARRYICFGKSTTKPFGARYCVIRGKWSWDGLLRIAQAVHGGKIVPWAYSAKCSSKNKVVAAACGITVQLKHLRWDEVTIILEKYNLGVMGYDGRWQWD